MASLAPQLEELLPAADIAAVLVRLAQTDDRGNIDRVKALAANIQMPVRRCCSRVTPSWSRAQGQTART